MKEDGLFLGHTTAYWLELHKQARELNAEKLLEELVEVKGKLSFVESRLAEVNKVINTTPAS